jgi:uncharacterized membrane protein
MQLDSPAALVIAQQYSPVTFVSLRWKNSARVSKSHLTYNFF